MRIVAVLLFLASCSRSAARGGPTDEAPSGESSAAPAGSWPKKNPAALPTTVRPVKHVLLITVDALRADQPWVGYGYARTPALDRLAARSIVYSRVYSLANHTTPSLAGLLSGRYPSELTRDRCALTTYKFTSGLASLLSDAGIYTFAAHGHAIFAGKTRPATGFQEWKVLDRAAGMRVTEGGITGEDIAAMLVAFLRQRTTKRDESFFAWAHFVDPHDAYVRHEAFPPSGHSKRGAYDGEVAYEDHVIGGVLDALEENGFAHNTAVIVSADHGEAFGEHGYFRHGFSMYDEEIRVPFIAAIPDLAPRQIDVVRSAIDLAPTIAALYGLSPPATWRGQSLLSDLTTATPRSRHALVDTPEVDTRHPLQAVITDPYKVMLQGRGGRVFDLRADPDEKTEVTGEAATEAIDYARNVAALLEPAPSSPCGLNKLASILLGSEMPAARKTKCAASSASSKSCWSIGWSSGT